MADVAAIDYRVSVTQPADTAVVTLNRSVWMKIEHDVPDVEPHDVKQAIADIVDMRKRGHVGVARVYTDDRITFERASEVREHEIR